DEFNLSLERYITQYVVAEQEWPLWSPDHPLVCKMSKRNPATASQHAHSKKIAAQRANQAVIRSPKNHPLRSVAAGSTEWPPEGHNDSKQEAPLVERPEAP